MSLDHLAQEIGGQIPPIAGIGGIMVEPEGFIMMNVQVPCVKGYNDDQIAIVMEDLGLKDFQVILGTATIYRVMEVIKESKISELAIPWTSSRLSWLMRDVHCGTTPCGRSGASGPQVWGASIWPQSHSWKCEPCFAGLQNECDDSWPGEEVTFTPIGHRCAKRLCYAVHGQQ